MQQQSSKPKRVQAATLWCCKALQPKLGGSTRCDHPGTMSRNPSAMSQVDLRGRMREARKRIVGFQALKSSRPVTVALLLFVLIPSFTCFGFPKNPVSFGMGVLRVFRSVLESQGSAAVSHCRLLSSVSPASPSSGVPVSQYLVSLGVTLSVCFSVSVLCCLDVLVLWVCACT